MSEKQLTVEELVELGEDGLQEHMYNQRKGEIPEETKEVEEEEKEEVKEETKEDIPEETKEVEEEEKEEVKEEIPEETTNPNDFLKDKKIKVKFNKAEVDIEGDKVTELIQKGLAYDSKSIKFKDAQNLDNKLKSSNITERDIEALIKYKTDPENGLKDFLALQDDLDLEKLQDDIYEFSKDDLVDRKTQYEAEKANYNPIISEIIPTISNELQQKSIEVFNDIPGLQQFSDRTVMNKDVGLYKNIIKLTEDGSFSEIKNDFINKYIRMSQEEKEMLNNNNEFFLNTYNTVANEYNSKPTTNVQEKQEEVNQPTPKMKLKDVEEKRDLGKPKPSQPTKAEKKKQSTQEYINSLVNLGLEDETKLNDKVYKKSK